MAVCRLRTLVDTGATRTLIRQDKWNEVQSRNGLPRYLGAAERIRSLSGDLLLLPTVGVGQVMICNEPIPVIVVPTLQHELLLGDDALRLLRAKLDFTNNTVSIGERLAPILAVGVAEVAGMSASAVDHWRAEFPDVFGQPNPVGCKLDVEFTIELKSGPFVNARTV